MTPVELHVGQDTGSPAQATAAPLIRLAELPDMTLPPAVVPAVFLLAIRGRGRS